MFFKKYYLGYFLKNKMVMSMFLFIVTITSLLVIPISFAGDVCEELPADEQEECYRKEIEEAKEKEDSISDKLEEIRDQKDSVLSQISGLTSQISVTQSEINSLQASINDMTAKLNEINQELQVRKEKLSAKTQLRDKVLRDHYRTSMLNTLEMFGSLLPSPTSSGELTGFQYSAFKLLFGESIANEAVKLIEVLGVEISQFEKDKNEAEELKTDLEIAQQNLLSAKQELDEKKMMAEENLDEIEDEESDVEEDLFNIQDEINKLSSRQQAIISAKAGEGIVSGYEAAEYTLPDSPYDPGFAAMSYGAFTHYNGMSQYGAKGRAEDGQSYKEILEHYYNTDVEKKDDFPDNIKVEGYDKMDFQKYLYGIAEMPSSWPEDALKAQAIAARTYAYGYAKAGKTICTTQSCQVFLKSKSDDPPDRWKDAVDDTKDMVLDDPENTQYSSTTGGYLNQSGWDLDGDDWPQDAYEKKAKSPWFYKAWYTESYTESSSKCGRSTPWLNEEEMADILNAWVVWRKGSGDEKDHISPVTTSCWGGDPYSNSEMKDKAEKYGDGYDKINDIDVEISSGGYTSKIKFDTDEGSVSIDGSEFKTVFNLRAPAYVAIRSRLYDIEID